MTALAAAEPDHVDAATLASGWTAALKTARAALSAADYYLPAAELRTRAHDLDVERDATVALLRDLARDQRGADVDIRIALTASDARQLLGLPAAVRACVFNADGVLIGSAALHAAAWAETFNEFIARRVERTGGQFAPFSEHLDYDAHIHGRPRLEGVRAFLASRGISLPLGDPADPPGAETVFGLANRKREALLRLLDQHPLAAYEGSRRYLELARDADVARAVVSASTNTGTMLEHAGLADLIDARVDGATIAEEHLRGRPAPDVLLAACRRLGVRPERAAVFETTPSGIEAARAAGFAYIVDVERTARKAVASDGANRVVSGLDELLELRRAA
jgi:HAD superfamily hydrolase (TIGR01509 family)